MLRTQEVTVDKWKWCKVPRALVANYPGFPSQH